MIPNACECEWKRDNRDRLLPQKDHIAHPYVENNLICENKEEKEKKLRILGMIAHLTLKHIHISVEYCVCEKSQHLLKTLKLNSMVASN